jgi:hypothetical protein
MPYTGWPTASNKGIVLPVQVEGWDRQAQRGAHFATQIGGHALMYRKPAELLIHLGVPECICSVMSRRFRSGNGWTETQTNPMDQSVAHLLLKKPSYRKAAQPHRVA